MNSINLEMSMFDRKKLAKHAITASISARKVAKANLIDPVNVYDACEAHGITVRFNDISMEGMYDREPKPRIHISALRPLVRRNVTCAHELGHHVFGHGTTIDEMNDQTDVGNNNDPIEYIANQFAYHFMMPALGIRNAFARRHIDAEQANSKQMFCVASNYGVGFTSLLTHLRYGLQMLSEPKYQELRRNTPKSLRKDILLRETKEPLVLVDDEWSSPTVDLESGDYLVLPSKPTSNSDQVQHLGDVPDGQVFRAVRSGIARIELNGGKKGVFVRIAKRSWVNDVPVGYIGLGRYRHLEEDDDE